MWFCVSTFCAKPKSNRARICTATSVLQHSVFHLSCSKYEPRKRPWTQLLSNSSRVGVKRQVKHSDGSLERDGVKAGLHHQGASMFLQKLMAYWSVAGIFCFMVGISLTIQILRLICPSLAKKIVLKLGESSTMTQNPNFKFEDWGPTFGSKEFIKTASYHLWMSLGQEAFVGGEAPDSPVVTMKGETKNICKYLNGEFWGSCFSGVVLSLLLDIERFCFVFLCRQQTAGAEFWKLHLTPVYLQTWGVQATRQGFQWCSWLSCGLHRGSTFNRWVKVARLKSLKP